MKRMTAYYFTIHETDCSNPSVLLVFSGSAEMWRHSEARIATVTRLHGLSTQHTLGLQIHLLRFALYFYELLFLSLIPALFSQHWS